MEGLLFYSDLFALWIENLSRFWSFLNSNVVSLIDSAISSIAGNGNSPALALFEALKGLFFVFGFQNLTVLGFLFSIMGYGFSLFFAITVVRWIIGIFT